MRYDHPATTTRTAAHVVDAVKAYGGGDTAVRVLDTVSVGCAGKAAVEQVAARYGDPEVQTRDEFAESSAGGIPVMLTLVHALLALAVLIALLGRWAPPGQPATADRAGTGCGLRR